MTHLWICAIYCTTTMRRLVNNHNIGCIHKIHFAFKSGHNICRISPVKAVKLFNPSLLGPVPTFSLDPADSYSLSFCRTMQFLKCLECVLIWLWTGGNCITFFWHAKYLRTTIYCYSPLPFILPNETLDWSHCFNDSLSQFWNAFTHFRWSEMPSHLHIFVCVAEESFSAETITII